MLLRSTTVDAGKAQGKDSVTKLVRASSKPGAIITARVDAIGQIPIRSQKIGVVQNKGNSRFLDKWKVEIRDKQELEDLGV